jgi:membrane protein DedA with SNARE-associated domain
VLEAIAWGPLRNLIGNITPRSWAAHPESKIVSRPTNVGYKYRQMLKSLMEWYMGALESGGYPLIALLMAIESSVVPLPSEVVIPPAAHLAHTSGKLSLLGVIFAGTIGSWIGASAMYWGARLAGRPLFIRYGKYIFIPQSKIEGAERWAAHYGSAGIFMSRLLPVVRHLIGIPAGVVRMNFKNFSIYTLLGSAIWCAVLAYIGVKMGQDRNLMAGQVHRISAWVGGGMLVLGGMYYFFVHRQMKKLPPDSKPAKQP